MRRIFSVILLTFAISPAFGFEETWLKVLGAEAAGNLELASETVAQLETRALEEGRSDQWLRAFSANYRLLQQTEEHDRTVLLPVFADFVNSLSGETALLGNLAMAHFYRAYYEDHRKIIDSRGEHPGGNIADWNRRQFYDAVFGCFWNVLSGAETLKELPSRRYAELLNGGEELFSRCPTVFDLALHDMIALCALTASSKTAAQAGGVFADAESFVEKYRRPDRADDPFGRALSLYAQLLAFHREDKDLQVFAFCDLERLKFCARFRASPADRKAYIDALEQFIAKWRRLEISAAAAALRAEAAVEASENAIAGVFATRAIAAFPNSEGAEQCRKIVAELEKPAFELSLPGRWSPNGVELSATYKNVNALYFRLIPVTRNDLARMKNNLLDRRRLASLSRKTPSKSWMQLLPQSSDNVPRTFAFSVMRGLKSGHYLLQVSTSRSFENCDADCSFPVSVSDFSLALKIKAGRIGGVLQRVGGAEASSRPQVSLYKVDKDGTLSSPLAVAVDDNGLFGLRVPKGRFMVVAGDRASEVLSEQILVCGTEGSARDGCEILHFLTDRTSVVPGESIAFSGIAGAGVPGLRIIAPDGRTVKSAEVVSGEDGYFRGVLALPPVSMPGDYKFASGDRTLARFEVREEDGEEDFSPAVLTNRNMRISLELPSAFAPSDMPIPFSAKLEGGRALRGELHGTLSVFAVETPGGYRFDAQRDGDWREWKVGKKIDSREIPLFKEGARGSLRLEPGLYELRLSFASGGVSASEARARVYVFDRSRKRFNLPLSSFAAFGAATVKIGEKLSLFWGTKHERASALVFFERNGEVLHARRLSGDAVQGVVEFVAEEKHAGIVDAYVIFAHAGDFYSHHQRFSVLPKEERSLRLTGEALPDTAFPGKKQRWRIKVEDEKGAAVENIAAMLRFGSDRVEAAAMRSEGAAEGGKFELQNGVGVLSFGSLTEVAVSARRREPEVFSWKAQVLPAWRADVALRKSGGAAEEPGEFEISRETSNLFLQRPEIASCGSNGLFEVEFEVPDIEGERKIELLAYDRSLRSGTLAVEKVRIYSPAVVREEFASFARCGDEPTLAFTIVNNERLAKRGSLTLSAGGESGAPVKRLPVRDFSVEAGGETTVGWSVKMPEREGTLRYSVKLELEGFSDEKAGEIAVFERGGAPAAVRAVALETGRVERVYFPLPAHTGRLEVATGNCIDMVLTERLKRLCAYDGNCSERLFARYFAERLTLRRAGAHSGGEDSKSSGADTLNRLLAMRLPDGLWPWHEGGQKSVWTSLRILAGFGRLHLMTGERVEGLDSAIAALDRWCVSAVEVRKSAASGAAAGTPSFLETLYLYTRSFYAATPFANEEAEAAFSRVWSEALASYGRMGAFSRAALALAAEGSGRSAEVRRIVSDFEKEYEERGTIAAAALLPLVDGEKRELKNRMLASVLERGAAERADEGVGVQDILWVLAQFAAEKKDYPRADLWFWERKIALKEREGGYAVGELEPDGGGSGIGLVSAENAEKDAAFVLVRGTGAAAVSSPSDEAALELKRSYYIFDGDEPRLWDGRRVFAPGERMLIRTEVRAKRDLEYLLIAMEKPACAETVEVREVSEIAEEGWFKTHRAAGLEYVFERLPAGEYVFEQVVEFFATGRFYSGASRGEALYVSGVSARNDGVVVEVVDGFYGKKGEK